MIHLIGNAHLDPAWMWTIEEGLEAFLATCRSALDRIQEFDDFLFTCSSAAHYEFVLRTDPKLFRRIQIAVEQGRWCIVGGWWVEPDCNLPSGESFVRQALLGQQFFQRHFGRIATIGFNVDSFGHHSNLPQLLRKSGLKAYIFMRPEQSELALPAALFNWQGSSGDVIPAYRLPLHYSNFRQSVGDKLASLPALELYNASHDWAIFYGVGNHGGGPTIEQLSEATSIMATRSDVRLSNPERFFASVDTSAVPTLHQEMQPHAIGCYSAHSEIKRLNRKAESALFEAEFFGVLADALTVGAPTDLSQAWKNVCFTQFHDLLGGVSIEEACEQTVNLQREAISIAERSRRESIQSIASQIDTSRSVEYLIVFNPTPSHQVWIEFELWHPHASERGEPLIHVALVSETGERIPTQKIEPSGKIGEDRARFLARVEVEPYGWRTFALHRHEEVPVYSSLVVTETAISNGIVTLDTNNTNGWYTPPAVYVDGSDTWGHNNTGFGGPTGEFTLTSVEVIESGPLRAGIRIRSHYNESRVEEEFFICAGDQLIEQRVFVDWREQDAVGKLRYRHGVKDAVARYEIPYGHVERPIGANEWPGQTWVHAGTADSGLAVVTDSKYSYAVHDEFIEVVMTRSPLVAHHVPPHIVRGGERLRYLDQGIQEFRCYVLPHSPGASPTELQRISARLHHPAIAHVESSHNGELPPQGALVAFAGSQTYLGAIKRAEDGIGVIVRVIGSNVSETVSLPLHQASVRVSFGNQDVRSFRVTQGSIMETDLIERPIQADSE